MPNIPRLKRINSGKDPYLFQINNRWAVIYEYLEGNHLTSFTNEEIQMVGKELARIHQKSMHFRFKGKRESNYDYNPKRLNRILKVIKSKKIPHPEILPYAVQVTKETYVAKLPQGHIHVDVKPGNLLFKKGKISGILDFDNSYPGPLLMDVGKSMSWFGLENKRINIDKALQVVVGYNSVRKLTSKELDSLYKMLKYTLSSHLITDYWFYSIGRIKIDWLSWVLNNMYPALKSIKITEEEFNEKLRNLI